MNNNNNIKHAIKTHKDYFHLINFILFKLFEFKTFVQTSAELQTFIQTSIN